MDASSAGLLGALIGGGATLLATWLTLQHERKLRTQEWERAERSRFHPERRLIYARFHAAVSDTIYEVAGDTSLGEAVGGENRQRLGAMRAEVEMIAGSGTRTFIEDVMLAVDHFSRQRRNPTADRVVPALRLEAALEDFIEAARRELGMGLAHGFGEGKAGQRLAYISERDGLEPLWRVK